MIAAFLAAGEVEVLAQGVEERCASVESERVRCAVDPEGYVDGGAGSGSPVYGRKGGKAGGCGGTEEAGGFEETTTGDLDFGWCGFGFWFKEMGVGAGGGAHNIGLIGIETCFGAWEDLSASTLRLMSI